MPQLKSELKENWREAKDGLWLLEKKDVEVWFDHRGDDDSIYAYEDGEPTDQHKEFTEVKKLKSLIRSRDCRSVNEF